MRNDLRSLVLVLPLAATTLLAAQDPSAEMMPSPKTEAHEALASLVGTWRVESEMAAMPGVPGMEKPTVWTGIERAELICNGLWLKVTSDSSTNGQEVHGVWMLGYDPHQELYKCIAVSNMEPGASCLDATYDAEQKSWHYVGETPAMGSFRATFVQDGADRSVETCYTANEDGEDVQFMRSVRTRITEAEAAKAAAGEKPPAIVDAKATKPNSGTTEAADRHPALAALYADLGTWDADWKMTMPGIPPMESPCREVVEPICGGHWTWSTFTGDMMGQPFKGHALTGYDSASDRVVSFWFDTWTSPYMRTEGTFAPGTRAFRMEGESYDEQGEIVPVASTATSTADGKRIYRMTFGEGEAQSVMTITYTRAKD
jgi:hypothetical protein